MSDTFNPPRDDATFARTSAEVVLEHLKDDILTGRLPPGTKLVERDLTERYSVSRTPLREALNNLVASHLATNVPYRGVHVRQVDLAFARDVYELRATLEGLAGQLAAERATRDEFRQIELHYRYIERLSRMSIVDQEVRNEIMRRNTRFHKAIATAAHNPLLFAKIEEVWTSVSLVRFHVWQSEDRIESSRHEHAEILAALRARDGETMQKLCSQHAFNAWEHVARVLSGEAQESPEESPPNG